MNESLHTLEPKRIWAFFQELSRIPRASGKTQAVQAWLKQFATDRNLPFVQDAVGNLVIRKAASPGKEDRPSVCLQAHMDMVCEKNADSTHDFDRDPIEMYIDGEWLKAKGTTLGADNGIGMAAQLAVLDDTSLQHGPVECLFTVDEETGLVGAYGLGSDVLKSDLLINLDSEDEGEIFIGCAGGMNSRFTFDFEQEPLPDKYFCFQVNLSGLQGGHSGDDIEKGRGNANHLLARFMWQLHQMTDLRLIEFTGGNLSNAIPREASFSAAVPHEMKEPIRVEVNCFLADLEEEYGDVEPKMRLDVQSIAKPEKVLRKADSTRFISALYSCPTGVIRMSQRMPGMVETSLNLASVKPVSDQRWIITTSQRSSIETAKQALSQRLEALFRLAGMDVEHGDGYPGWKPNPSSALVQNVSDAYLRLFAKEARVRTIHAGLECGLFLSKYPGLDMVSFGPTMRGVHSPDERMHIPSVQPFWDLLVETLRVL